MPDRYWFLTKISIKILKINLFYFCKSFSYFGASLKVKIFDNRDWVNFLIKGKSTE